MSPATQGPRLPPSLTDATSVLVSQIPLPPLPYVAWAKFVPGPQVQQQHKAVELARQRIVNGSCQTSQGVLNSLLPNVHISKQEAILWVFAIGSDADASQDSEESRGREGGGCIAVEALEALGFDNLERCQLSRFTPATLYPCSSECAQSPCSSCTRATPDSADPRVSAPSASTLLPRVSLRPAYSSFIAAICTRLIDDMCATSNRTMEAKDSADLRSRPQRRTPGAIRLGNGILSYRGGAVPLWGSGWEHNFRGRHLTHTALDVYLSLNAIHVCLLPTVTTLLPMPTIYSPSISSHLTTSSLPAFATNISSLTPGCPLILAPYSTPSFYVSTHTRASTPSSLLTQFWNALTGLGTSSLPSPSRFYSLQTASSKSPSPGIPSANLCHETFVLVIIPLFNPQGDPKGITTLWPAHLTFIDTSPSRLHLKHLPEMSGMEALLTPPRSSGAPSASQPSVVSTPIRLHRQPSGCLSVNAAHQTQRIFRALELSSHKRAPGMPIVAIAKHAAGYVESVAREREKERERANQERIKREREMKEGRVSFSGPPASTALCNGSAPSSSSPAVSGPLSPKPIPATTRLAPMNSVLTTFFAKVAQGNDFHSFYPSPPDWDPVASGSGLGSSDPPSGYSSLVASTATGVNSSSDPPSQPNLPPETIGDTLDLSNGINLGMDIDMTMNMGINLNDTIGMMGVDVDATGIMDGTFGAFTDDDFNFFDSAPSAGATTSTVPHMQDPLHALGPDEGAVDEWLAHGLGGPDQHGNTNITDQLPLHETSSLLQPITPASAGVDPSTHEPLVTPGIQISEDDSDPLPPPPELIPSSPAKTPYSPGDPPTPSLEFTLPEPTAGKTMFDPIIFGKSHRIADGKYEDAKGKFSFLHTRSKASLRFNLVPENLGSPLSGKYDGWKMCYDAVTDPRVGIINRLRGVKRKLSQKDEYPKSVKDRAREEWESIYDHEETDGSESSSSEGEDDAEEPEPGSDEDASSLEPHPSRPSTPPPPGLPVVPTLLHSHFHHTHILPMGVPMRSSYVDLLSNDDAPAVPISVPTPVSPAAALGGAAERNKTLELLAQAVAKEAVENDIWAEAWVSSSDMTLNQMYSSMGCRVSQRDLKQISELMGKVDGLRGPLSLSSLLEPFPSVASSKEKISPVQTNKLQLMHPPRLSIGRAGLAHHMLPPAIRFWEKEGLGPRGGAKNVLAFALFEEGDDQSVLIEKWMERVSRAYSARGLGTHTAGKAGSFERGLVPLQFEAVRKTLPNFISALPMEAEHIVIYVIAPSTCCSLKSTALRTIINSRKRVTKLAGQHDFDQDRVLMHFVPDYLVTDPHTYPTTRHVGLERFVTSVYDRLSRPTLRQTSRQLWEYTTSFENRFQVPAFVLARKSPPETHFEWTERPSLNVLDRHTFLHVGYRLSQCHKWLLAACIDERGEAHDIAVWCVPNQTESLTNTWIVSNIWIFAKQFWQRADTEWRVVVAKLGELSANEAEEWMSHLQTVVSAHTGPPIHVSLVCAQNDVPLPFLCPSSETKNSPSSAGTNSHSVFADVSSMTYSAFLSQRMPIVSSDTVYSSQQATLIKPRVAEDVMDDVPPDVGVLPLHTTALFRVPNETDMSDVSTLYIHLVYAQKSTKSTLQKTTEEVHADLTRNWYELAVLTRERWNFWRHGELPFHLGALEVMSEVLDPVGVTPNGLEVEYLGA